VGQTDPLRRSGTPHPIGTGRVLTQSLKILSVGRPLQKSILFFLHVINFNVEREKMVLSLFMRKKGEE
jgi:hypothetical protein